MKLWVKHLKTNQRIGVVMADAMKKENGTYKIGVGYSLWHSKLDKRCNWITAENIAAERMLRDSERPYHFDEIPESIRGSFVKLGLKANRRWCEGENDIEVIPRDLSEFFYSTETDGLQRFYGVVSKRESDLVQVKSVGDRIFNLTPPDPFKFNGGDFVRIKVRDNNVLRIDRV